MNIFTHQKYLSTQMSTQEARVFFSARDKSMFYVLWGEKGESCLCLREIGVLPIVLIYMLLLGFFWWFFFQYHQEFIEIRSYSILHYLLFSYRSIL